MHIPESKKLIFLLNLSLLLLPVSLLFGNFISEILILFLFFFFFNYKKKRFVGGS